MASSVREGITPGHRSGVVSARTMERGRLPMRPSSLLGRIPWMLTGLIFVPRNLAMIARASARTSPGNQDPGRRDKAAIHDCPCAPWRGSLEPLP